MPDIVSKRQTIIAVTDDSGLYPANDLYPSDDLFPRDAGFVEITNIVQGSLKLSEIISERIPQFGQLFASKFECKVYLTDDLHNKIIQVYQLDDGVYKPIFIGRIDSCKLDKVGTDRTIVAYDFAYTYGQINVAPWWTQFWQTRQTSTLKQCRESMLEWAGIFYEDITLPNDNLVISKTVDLTNCPFNNMLRMMCELNYCFPHFDRDGQMIFILLNTEPEHTIDLDGLYEWASSDFEEFETDEIDGVQFFDSGNQLKYSVGETNNAYPIKQNIFLYNQSTQVLIDIGEEFLSYLEDLRYTPSNIKMIAGDLSYKVGDYCHTSKGNFYILKNTLSGSQLFNQNIKAEGQQVLYGGTPHLKYGEIVLDEKIARVSYDLDQFQIEYADFKEGTSARFTITDEKIETEVTRAKGAEGTLSSRITQTAESITSEVTRATNAEGTLSSRITQTATSISSEVTRATNAEGTLSSRITQEAGRITSEITRAQGAEGTLSSRITQTESSISSEVTRAKGAEGTLSSRITQTAESITSEITRATGAEGSLSSRISQNADAIDLRVEKSGVIAAINLSSEQATIEANKVNLNGYVTVTSLQSDGSTEIDGSRIKTGVITGSTPNASFSINMENGEVIMNNAKFNGTVTGSVIQSSPSVGDPLSSTRVVMDNTSTIKGYDGSTPYNWINMMQSGGTHHMIIDAAESLDIAVHQLFVSEDTTQGAGGAAAYKGRTDSYTDYYDERLDVGRSCYRICDVRKYMPGEFTPQEAQAINLGEYTLNAPWGGTAQITLPVYLKIRYMNERRIHGFVIDNGVAPINIPHFDI